MNFNRKGQETRRISGCLLHHKWNASAKLILRWSPVVWVDSALKNTWVERKGFIYIYPTIHICGYEDGVWLHLACWKTGLMKYSTSDRCMEGLVRGAILAALIGVKAFPKFWSHFVCSMLFNKMVHQEGQMKSSELPHFRLAFSGSYSSSDSSLSLWIFVFVQSVGVHFPS